MFDWAGFWSASIGGLFGGATCAAIFLLVGTYQHRQQVRRWEKRERERDERLKKQPWYNARE